MQRRRLGARASDAKRRIKFHMREAMRSAIDWHSGAGQRWMQIARRQKKRGQIQLAQLQARYIAFSARCRKHAARKLLRVQEQVQMQRQLRREQLTKLRASPAPSKWYAWISAKYWKYADKLEAFAQKSSAGRFFSTNFGLKPQGLALGFAEGTILFKFTSPVILPLQLWLLVNFFKQQRLKTFLASAPASCENVGARESCQEELSPP